MLKKMIIDIKKNTVINEQIFLLLLSIIFVGIFKDYVNGIVTCVLLPEARVEIMLPAKVEIEVRTDDVTKDIQEKIFGSQKHEVTWDGNENEGFVAICNFAQDPAEYVFIPYFEGLKEVSYSIDGKNFINHIVTEGESSTGGVKIYPFSTSIHKVVFQLIIYALLIVLFFLLFLQLHILLKKRTVFSRFFTLVYKKDKLWLVGTWALLYIVAVIEYKFNIGLPHYIPDNAIGDQKWYWERYILRSCRIDFEYCAKMLLSFRGYTTCLFSSFSRMIGNHTGIDPVMIYLLFPSFFFSWLATVIMPRLYVYAMKKPVRTCSVIAFTIITVFYWNPYLTAVLMDYYSVTLFFASIAYFILAMKDNKIWAAMLTGISFGVMVNMRVQYFYAMIVIGVGCAAVYLYKNLSNCVGASESPKDIFTGILKKIIKLITSRLGCFAWILIAFLLVSLPQGIINYKQTKHIGLLPYDYNQAMGEYSISNVQFNFFLSNGMYFFPYFYADDQLATMKTQIYADRRQELEIVQCLDVYANSPIETIICFIKKIITILDVKSNIQYPDIINWRATSGLAFSFVNYLILAIGLYIFFCYKKITKRERIVSVFILIGNLPTVLVGHCEWRYAFPLYMLLYFAMSFHYVGEVIGDNDNYKTVCNWRFFRFLVVAELIGFLISLTIWA